MTIEPGVLLLAEPAMQDPNFRRAAILLCDHDEEGSFGLILNKPSNLHLAEVLIEPNGLDQPLYLGGPVQPDTLHFLHSYLDEIPEAIIVGNELAWGGPFEEIAENLRVGSMDPARFRFFAGYAGWGPGQLDDEIEEGTWIVLNATQELVLNAPTERMWQDQIIAQGGETALLVNYPVDPQYN